MTNSFTGTNKKVVGSIDSTGASDSITVSAGQLVDVSIDFDTNSFSGTIQLQRKTNTGASNVGEWQTIESYSASAEKVAQSATQREYRLNCSAAASGTAEVELTAGVTV
jgi:hypothetical protein